MQEKKEPDSKEIDALIKKAEKPSKEAEILHPYYKGKIEIISKVPVRDFSDFAIWYTPGVAKSCKIIHQNKEEVYSHTNKWNNVAVISDGTRVLGLGNIGPEAGMPVMEGKALLFKYLGGVDAIPLCLDTSDPEKIIETVKILQPSFGGINLEDIESPKCFYVLERLRKELDIPVWHDDQQGTAAVELAGAINALKYVGKKMSQAKFAVIGSGAANIAFVRILISAGVPGKNIIITDSRGTLHPYRKDIESSKHENPYKWNYCLETNGEVIQGGTADAMKGADIMIAASKPGPGTIKKEWIKLMADNPVVFPVANPVPEIWPWEAREAGAVIVGTGRSDFPNQVNNSLGFPGIFRGTLDVRATTITDEMAIAAACELANVAEEKGLSPEYIIPSMGEWEVFPREAVAVGLKAIEQGVARLKPSRQELMEKAEAMIRRSRNMTDDHMKNTEYIPIAPKIN